MYIWRNEGGGGWRMDHGPWWMSNTLEGGGSGYAGSYGQAQPLSDLIDQSLAKDRSMVKIACIILGRLGHL